MTGELEDMTFEKEVVSAAYDKLKTLSPDHELLKYVSFENNHVNIRPEYSDEFNKRFPPVNPKSGFKHRLYGIVEYYNAIARCLECAKKIH